MSCMRMGDNLDCGTIGTYINIEKSLEMVIEKARLIFIFTFISPFRELVVLLVVVVVLLLLYCEPCTALNIPPPILVDVESDNI
jgi:hypothetical protein